jgi:hypothetical protein
MDKALRYAPPVTAAFLQSDEGGRIIAALRRHSA